MYSKFLIDVSLPHVWLGKARSKVTHSDLEKDLRDFIQNQFILPENREMGSFEALEILLPRWESYSSYCESFSLPRWQVLGWVSSNSLFPCLPLKLLLEKLWKLCGTSLVNRSQQPTTHRSNPIWAEARSVLPWLFQWQRAWDARLQSV